MAPSVNLISNPEFGSEETVELELNTLMRTLKLTINNNLVSVVSCVDCRAVRPYVCIKGVGSFSLIEKNTQQRLWGSLGVEDKEWQAGFDNTVWDEEFNEELLKDRNAGAHCNYCTQGIASSSVQRVVVYVPVCLMYLLFVFYCPFGL